jgi:hypothetical protein
MVVIWDVAPCCLVDIGRRFRVPYCSHRRRHVDGDSKYLLNVGLCLQNCTRLLTSSDFGEFFRMACGRKWFVIVPGQ